jgi:uncharacterized protein YutE (UPF0331/DUF86 family)
MRERILQKAGRIRQYLALLNQLKGDCQEKFTTDLIYRGAVLHYLYLMADSCISLAEMLINQQELRPPQSYHEAFDILGEAGVLDAEFAYSFAKIAGFRNFLAHDYETVDAEVICQQVLQQLDDVAEYLRQAGV